MIRPRYRDWTAMGRLYARMRIRKLNGMRPKEAQNTTLKLLLKQATDTKFGKAHRFGDIDCVEDFQRQVPIRGYDAFWREWWEPNYPSLVDVSWPGEIPFFTITSGTTTGRSKFIPYTAAMRRAAVRGFLDLLCYHLVCRPGSRLLGGATLALTGPVALEASTNGSTAAAVSAITISALPSWLQGRVLPSGDLANIKDWQEKIRRLAPLSIADDIRFLGGSPNWLLIFLAEVAKHAPGQTTRLADWYPNLELILHGGVDFSPYRDQFRALLEGSHAETREMYSASEGVFAYADSGDGDGLRLHLDGQIFYEFVPLDQLSTPAPKRCWIGTVETGKNYALVISSAAGLWSYVVGDVVRFVDLDPPRLLVLGRVHQGLSSFGEHLIETEVAEAVMAAARKQGVTVLDYSVGTLHGETGGHHVYLVEHSGAGNELSTEAYATDIDARLSDLNDDYRELRRNEAISAPEIHFAPAGGFARWMRLRRGLGGQHKIPRIVTDPDLFRDIRSIVLIRKGPPDGL